jgi:MFS family permease
MLRRLRTACLRSMDTAVQSKTETSMQVSISRHRDTSTTRQANGFHALILLSAVICGTLAATVIGPVLPDMQRHFSAVRNIETLVPVVVTIPMLIVGGLAIIVGAMADKIGRKRVLVSALMLYAVAGTAPLYLDSIYSIIVSRVLVGAAEAAAITCSTTLIGDYFSGDRRDRYVSLQTTIASISAFIFNLLGGVLGEHSWRAPFAVYALPLLLVPFVQIFIWEPSRDHDRVAQVSTGATSARPLNLWFLVLICLVAFVNGAVFLMVPVHLSFMLVDLGMHVTSQIGLSYAMNSLGVIAGTLLLGWVLVGRSNVPVQLLIGTLLCGAGFMAMGRAHGYVTLTLGAVINGVGCGLLLPALVGWVLRTLPFERRGLGIGVYMASQFVGYFCNPIFVMPMVGRWGSRFPVVEAWGIGLIAIALLLLVGMIGSRRMKLG